MVDARTNDGGKRKAPPRPDGGTDAAREHTEKLLDEALKESFPASDPPSIPSPQDD